jgi:hypothetical protein
MVSDIVRVLQSEHRELLILADQCGRTSRGFHDPASDLERRLRAHVRAAAEEVLPPLLGPAGRAGPGVGASLQDALDRVTGALEPEPVPRQRLAGAARELVEVERAVVLPAVASLLHLPERRRMGTMFRLRRDTVLGAGHSRRHRAPSQTELYELARRAGVEQRSTMSQTQLLAAVGTSPQADGCDRGIAADGLPQE